MGTLHYWNSNYKIQTKSNYMYYTPTREPAIETLVYGGPISCSQIPREYEVCNAQYL